jgi:hypothetical protein
MVRIRSSRLLATACSAAFLLFAASVGHATTINVTIDSTALDGLTAVLAFDFIDGGSPDNTVTLSALTSNGTQDSTSTTGNVTGTGPWTFSDAGGSFFNELLVTFNPMGTSLSFSFTTTDNAPDAGSFPDAFSMFVLDSTATLPLITTDDPTTANALFLFNLGQGSAGLTAYTADQAGFSVSASSSPTPAPEPGILPLLLAGAMALFARGRFAR